MCKLGKGCEGLWSMRKSGTHTVAQGEASSGRKDIIKYVLEPIG